jgi:hypothetical protein
MAKVQVELDENELALLPEMRRIHAVATKIGQHPKGREMLQQAVLLADPDSAGPEARIRAEVIERESAITKKLDEFLEKQAKKEEEAEAKEARGSLERRWLDGRSKATTAGYSGESLTNLEKFMEERGIADHEVAISHFERLNPPPPPSITGGSRWNFFDQVTANDDLGLKAFLDNPGAPGADEAFLARAVPAALKDVRGG